MRNRINYIKAKVAKNTPKIVQTVGNMYQKLHNLHSFVKLGCPDPTPSMYLFNLDSIRYRHAAVPIDVVNDMKSSSYVVDNYYTWLPPDPKSMAKITGI